MSIKTKILFLFYLFIILLFSLNLSAFQITIDASNTTHKISPYIYGLANNIPDLNATIIRWGGNPSTRYNWEIGNAWNHAADYQFRNTNYNTGPGSVADRAVRGNILRGAETILTIPAIGFVAKDYTSRSTTVPSSCGDNKASNPLQTSHPTFARKNSSYPNAIYEDPPNLTDSKVFIDEWLVHLKNNFTDKAPKFIAIDNEMDIWGGTHRDVHPKCSGYDEILLKFIEYSTMVKETLPGAKVLGPVSCCWWFYWNSQRGSGDKKAHNSTDFLPWFLQEARKYDLAAGKRTLDYLDIHFYLDDISFDKPDDLTRQKRRINATRSLWDPTYREEGWIGIKPDVTKQQPSPFYVQLIPRMKKLIADNYPGTKLALTEYNWGAENTIAGGIALADTLGIFGREQLDIATYWRNPKPNTYAYSAFKLYTNYFEDDSLPCYSEDYKKITCYTSKNDNNDIAIVLTNHDSNADYPLNLTLQNTTSTLNAVYQITEQKKNITLITNFNFILPKYSITLLQYKAAPCTEGETRSCGISDLGTCKFGTKTCSNGIFGDCIGAIVPIEETCNSLDDNCNGIVDDDCSVEPPAEKDPTPNLEPVIEEESIEQIEQECIPKWSCTPWGNCEDDIQRRQCILKNSCSKNRPKEIKFCDQDEEEEDYIAEKYQERREAESLDISKNNNQQPITEISKQELIDLAKVYSDTNINEKQQSSSNIFSDGAWILAADALAIVLTFVVILHYIKRK
ncbi:glycoside hydrolase family 44 protein [Candidatus Woesearchaeota archaeon]|nr:glycoside hydrolase family 44 protein [Candidatus Woesearchaeota archaeon]